MLRSIVQCRGVWRTVEQATTLTRRKRAAPALLRCLSTKDDNVDDMFVFPDPSMTDPNNTVYKHVHFDHDGNAIFEFDPNQKFDGNYSWKEFEHAHGLEKLHDMDFEEWEPHAPYSSVEFDSTPAKIRKAAMFMAKKQTQSPTEKLADEAKARESLRQLEDILHRAQEKAAAKSGAPVSKPSEEDGRTTTTCMPSVPSGAGMTDASTHTMDSVPEEEGAPTRQRSLNREPPRDGSTRKLDRARRAAEKAARAPSKRTKKTTPRPAVQLADGILQVPEDAKRPGYERRIRSLESQMERIATEVLCKPGSEFEDSGAAIRHVLLSPNGCTLSIYFETDDDVRPDGKHHASGHHAPWRKAIGSEVRSALARQLYAKRVPKVELVRLKPGNAFDDTSMAHDPSREVRELDNLFDQIAAERNQQR